MCLCKVFLVFCREMVDEETDITLWFFSGFARENLIGSTRSAELAKSGGNKANGGRRGQKTEKITFPDGENESRN